MNRKIHISEICEGLESKYAVRISCSADLKKLYEYMPMAIFNEGEEPQGYVGVCYYRIGYYPNDTRKLSEGGYFGVMGHSSSPAIFISKGVNICEFSDIDFSLKKSPLHHKLEILYNLVDAQSGEYISHKQYDKRNFKHVLELQMKSNMPVSKKDIEIYNLVYKDLK